MLFLFLGLSLASPAPNPIEDIVRIDRSSPFGYNFSAVHASVPFKLPSRQLVPGEEFRFTFQCASSIPARTCTMAENAFKNAGKRIAEVLNIRQTIVVQANFANLCGQQQDCGLLGAAAAASEFAVKLPESTVMYPQALIKQLNTDVPVPLSPVDIISQFNSRVGWYFRDDPSTAGPDQFDFELVAAHEIMHGLGFSSGMVDLSSVEDFQRVARFGDKFLTPTFYFEDIEKATISTPVSKLKPLNVYDYYVKGNSDANSYTALFKRMDAFPKTQQSIGRFLTAFQSSGDPFAAARAAFQLASSGTGGLTFQPPNGEPIILHSPRQYAQGSTGSHLDLASNSTANFLMVHALLPGRTIEQLVSSNRANSFFGPEITTIFETIGWNTKAKPTPIQSVVIDRSFGKSGAITHGFSLLLFVVLMI